MKKIIIDCDPGIDDSLAIMLALQSPELEVIGITIVAGNSPAELGFQNAKRVLNFLGRLDVPVYVGADRPRVREYVNALDTHGSDGLGESFLPEVPGQEIPEKSAVEFMREALKGGDVSVIALGPLTNLADLIDADISAFLSIERLVSMGGNFRSHGNCSPVAEYNYWEDPDSAKVVFDTLYEHHKMIEMVGLDVTREIVLTPEKLEDIKARNAVVGDFIEKITKFYFKFHWEWEHIRGCVINDPLAVAQFICPNILDGIEAFTEVETGGISMGQTVVDSMGFYRKESNALVFTNVDVEAFWELFLTRILEIGEKK
ncbi:purine nucleosidase [Butyrivibrio sp. INlla18]|uniref:nucleoside hydrolase n=1 Tax=Butyrivibrio sp. INlla18 TaxID=1520806 RepID=UPI00087E2154|nr:nucleoside hydrolase [Butyrivibrio sp. INlla18]SDA62390.1 purine nucleosidase [Butyrivibrio sp. INlla18]